MSIKNLIFVDVDGVLIPSLTTEFSNSQRSKVARLSGWHSDSWKTVSAPWFANLPLSTEPMKWLRRFEEFSKISWLTSWGSDAPEYLSRVAGGGLNWDVLDADQFPDGADRFASDWWKANAVKSMVNPSVRKIVWIDDDIADWVDQLRHDIGLTPAAFLGLRPEQLLLISPNLRVGVTLEDMEKVNAFLRG